METALFQLVCTLHGTAHTNEHHSELNVYRRQFNAMAMSFHPQLFHVAVPIILGRAIAQKNHDRRFFLLPINTD